MKKTIIIIVIVLIGWFVVKPLITSAASQTITCANWWKGGGGSGSCSGSTVTFTGTDNFWFDGAPFTSSTGYVMSANTVYYVVLNSPTGSGTGGVSILDNLGNESIVSFTAGGGSQNINITSPTTGSTYQTGLKSDFSGGPRISGDVTSFCISDVSFADCGGGGGSNSCTYSGTGDWNVKYSDNCYINTNIYIVGACNFMYDAPGVFGIANGASISCGRINGQAGFKIQGKAGARIYNHH